MTTAAVVAVAGAISTLDRPDGVRGWSGPCPCADPALCHPIDRPGNSENVYVFHTAKGGRHGNGNDWRSFDWSIITTICVFGKIDPLLLCHTHAHGARVTLGNGGPPPVHWNDTNAVDAWVNKSVASVTAAYADGINIDIESTVTAGTQAAALTAVAAKAAQAMHAANPHSHVSFDIPSAGMLQEGPCGSQYGREYDFQALANALDFLVVMDYDSNDPRGANPGPVSFVGGPRRPYVFASRAAAEEGCRQKGFPRLCAKAEIAGFSHCAGGWCSDWEGYWMSKARAGCGVAGYNSFQGLAGAYCCGGSLSPCDTCYFANAALPVVKAGVECYRSLGVPPNKLVLAFPWYGKDYECSETAVGVALVEDNMRCTVSSTTSPPLSHIEALLQAHALPPGRVWQPNSSTPHFLYADPVSGARHRVDYDDSQSLRLKYSYARSVGARGVGMWTADCVDSGNTSWTARFWEDLKVFAGGGAETR